MNEWLAEDRKSRCNLGGHGAEGKPRGGEWSLSVSHPLPPSLDSSLVSLMRDFSVHLFPIPRLLYVHPGSKGGNQDPEVRGRQSSGLVSGFPGMLCTKLLIFDLR